MLQLAEAGKRFGPKLLFEHANWLITAGERTALVGANGTGKSTLLKTLAGLDSLDYGHLQRTRGMSIGYLPQDGLSLSGRTVFEECLSVFDELRGIEKELEVLAASLAELDPESSAYAAAAERYSNLGARFHAHDGYAVTFSWHELFNTPIGERVLVAFERGDQPLSVDEGAPILFSAADIMPAPRHVKRLAGVVAHVLEL